MHTKTTRAKSYFGVARHGDTSKTELNRSMIENAVGREAVAYLTHARTNMQQGSALLRSRVKRGTTVQQVIVEQMPYSMPYSIMDWGVSMF